MDDPYSLYLTIAGVGASIAALFAVAGLVTRALPFVLFKWTYGPETLPWVYFVQTSTGRLRLGGPYPRAYGIAIQIALALVAIASVGVEVSFWKRRRIAAPRS